MDPTGKQRLYNVALTSMQHHNSHSTPLHTFKAMYLAEGKIIHLNKVQSRNPSALFSFRRLKKTAIFGNNCKIFMKELLL